MPYMVTFTINIPQMLAYIPGPWILWDILYIVLDIYLGGSRFHRYLHPWHLARTRAAAASLVRWRPRDPCAPSGGCIPWRREGPRWITN